MDTGFAWPVSGTAIRSRVRQTADCWWARQDSNLQPDRYERRDSGNFVVFAAFCLSLTMLVGF
jgi:hypothetical protein